MAVGTQGKACQTVGANERHRRAVGTQGKALKGRWEHKERLGHRNQSQETSLTMTRTPFLTRRNHHTASKQH